MNDHEPVIVGALRTPVGKRGGRLQKWHPVDLMAETLRQLVEQSGVNPSDLDDVIVGCVLQWDQQHGNLARHAVLAAGLPESVPAVTVDRQCGSGQQAVSFAVHGIQAGAYQLAIGGGGVDVAGAAAAVVQARRAAGLAIQPARTGALPGQPADTAGRFLGVDEQALWPHARGPGCLRRA